MSWLRTTAKYWLASALHFSGLLALWSWCRRLLGVEEVCVFSLHRVLTPQQRSHANSLPAMVLDQAAFAALLHYLSRHFHVLSLHSFLQGSLPEGRPSCLLTLDDGWQDNYTTAYPLLRQFGLPAIIFLTTGMIGTKEVFWVERLIRACKRDGRHRDLRSRFEDLTGKPLDAQGSDDSALELMISHLKRMPAAVRSQALARLLPSEVGDDWAGDRMLDWDQVAEMRQAGIEFGAHTATHPLLPFETDAFAEAEVLGSRQKILEMLSSAARAFAYPNGDWDPRIRQCVLRAGYECAFTTQRGWYRRADDRYTIRRVSIDDGRVLAPDGTFSPALFHWNLYRSS